MKTETKPIKTAAAVPEPFLAPWTIAPHAWTGRCPACGSEAVFRETEPGRVSGACTADTKVGCWWTT